LQSSLQNRQPFTLQSKNIPMSNFGQGSLVDQGNFSASKSPSLLLNSTAATRTILPNTSIQHNQQTYSYANGQQNFAQKGGVDLPTNSIYTPKGSTKQSKSVPNILSKSSTSGSGSHAGQTIILPSNMNGQYILVNSSAGQQSQPMAVQQNLNQLTQQQQQQQQIQIQPQDQQNPQLLVFPANIQQLVNNQGTSSSATSQNLTPGNELKCSQQQAPKLPPLRVRQNQGSSKGASQVNIAPLSKPLAPQSMSSAQTSQFFNQGISTLATGSQPISGQQLHDNVVHSIYRAQTHSQGKAGDELKIIRPVAQQKGITGKTVATSTIAKSTVNANFSRPGTSHTSKLSHFPMPQNQIKNLQSMVMQKGSEGVRQSTHPTLASSPSGQINVGTSTITQSLADSVSMVASQSSRTDQSNSNQNVALQQLLRLSQAASLSSGGVMISQGDLSSQKSSQPVLQTSNAVIQNSPVNYQSASSRNANLTIQAKNSVSSVGVDVPPQNLTAENHLNVGGDKGVKQQQLLKQLFSQQQQQQHQQQQLQQLQQQKKQQQQIQQLQQQQLQHLQPGQQQTSSPSSEVIRANIIGQNVQNIIMRQNASKQNIPKQSTLSPKLTTTPNQADNSNPMQLFIPKQLPTTQLIELQQKLLAGKILQKMQAVQPKLAPSSGTTVNTTSMVTIPASSSVQTVTLRQVPLATQSPQQSQLIMPVVTQGMQFFLQTNVTKQPASGNASPQQILVASGNNAGQRINLPIISASSAAASNLVKQVQGNQQKSSSLQGATVQHPATPNIIVKPLDAAGIKAGLSEQQRAVQTKKLQQLLLQLTPSQRNLLVKKQQQYVNKGQSVPLMKLIMEVKQENITVKQEMKTVKRPAADEAKVDDSSEPKVSKRLKHCLQADQARVTESNYKAAFNSLEDALSRLLPYHILNEEIPPDIEWHKAEALFNIVSKQLITRREKLFDKYHALLLEESQRQFSCSEMVMLERIFLADEKARFAKEKEDFKLGKLQIFQTPVTPTAAEDSIDITERETELEECAEVANLENGDIPAVVDTVNWNTTEISHTNSIDNEEESEQDEDVEIEEDDVEEERKTEENGEDELESDSEYQEEPDIVGFSEEEDDKELEEGDDIDEENEDEADDMEKEYYEEEEANDEDYISSLGINDISNQYINHEFEDLEDLEDLARTTERNMSEELSQATFNLMADLQNESSNDYFE